MLLAESLLGSSSTAANYIEDVFSTYLYTGNSTSGGTQTITNNIDLSTKGGMVWIKGRSAASDHVLFDTARGAGTTASNNLALSSNLTAAESLAASYDFLSAFNTNGFTAKQGGTTTATRGTNYSSVTYTSWTFRKQPKFFDVVTYTGNGANRTIAHSLGSVPGCIIIKQTTGSATDWIVYHRSLGNTKYIRFNLTDGEITNSSYWNNTSPTETTFALGTNSNVNGNSQTYVAYLFAHDAGGFGATGTDNVISCGSYTGNGSTTGPTITLGYEPQFLLVKQTNAAGTAWRIQDNMRSLNATGTANLFPNYDFAEIASPTVRSITPTATGFFVNPSSSIDDYNASGGTYIYIAIRRGPMKTPTTGTSVFSPIASSAATGTKLTTNFPVDLQIYGIRTGVGSKGQTVDRLRGISTNTTESGALLVTSSTAIETTTNIPTLFWDNTGFQMPSSFASSSDIFWNFGRAPGFFDIVCYTGTGANRTVSHNLGVVPELMIVKARPNATAWQVYSSALANTEYLVLNTTAAKATGATRWNSTTPTSSVFSLGTATEVNQNADAFVAYLFATVAGVSKVFSYTGNGTNQTINCGFTAGARFVLIKRTDSTGNWFVFDTARGIVTGNDPYLLLNSTAAEATTLDVIDPAGSGFIVNQEVNTNLNVNTATYIGLAIA